MTGAKRILNNHLQYHLHLVTCVAVRSLLWYFSIKDVLCVSRYQLPYVFYEPKALQLPYSTRLTSNALPLFQLGKKHRTSERKITAKCVKKVDICEVQGGGVASGKGKGFEPYLWYAQLNRHQTSSQPIRRENKECTA